jgi:hypothetical protein
MLPVLPARDTEASKSTWIPFPGTRQQSKLWTIKLEEVKQKDLAGSKQDSKLFHVRVSRQKDERHVNFDAFPALDAPFGVSTDRNPFSFTRKTFAAGKRPIFPHLERPLQVQTPRGRKELPKKL